MERIGFRGGEAAVRTTGAVKIKAYLPTTEEGRQELAQCAAAVHADYVCSVLRGLNCPEKQKNELIEAVIAAKK